MKTEKIIFNIINFPATILVTIIVLLYSVFTYEYSNPDFKGKPFVYSFVPLLQKNSQWILKLSMGQALIYFGISTFASIAVWFGIFYHIFK